MNALHNDLCPQFSRTQPLKKSLVTFPSIDCGSFKLCWNEEKYWHSTLIVEGLYDERMLKLPPWVAVSGLEVHLYQRFD